jgi:hypothetical protein
MSISLGILFVCGGLALAVLLGMVLYKEKDKVYRVKESSKMPHEDTEAA